jgi:hypothetical protein
MKRSASALWQGGLKDGKGTVSTESGVLKQSPYCLLNTKITMNAKLES